MAVIRVPDEVGMMVTGLHTTRGFLRYDKTQDLKMEAVVLLSINPNLNYQATLNEVSKLSF